MAEPDYFSMSTDDLLAAREEIDKERLALKEKGAAIAAILGDRARFEQAAYYGLTVAQYDEAKAVASADDSGVSLAKALAQARKKVARDAAVQVAKPQPAAAGARARGTR